MSSCWCVICSECAGNRPIKSIGLIWTAETAPKVCACCRGPLGPFKLNFPAPNTAGTIPNGNPWYIEDIPELRRELGIEPSRDEPPVKKGRAALTAEVWRERTTLEPKAERVKATAAEANEMLDDILSLCAKVLHEHDQEQRVLADDLIELRDRINDLRRAVADGVGYKGVPRLQRIDE